MNFCFCCLFCCSHRCVFKTGKKETLCPVVGMILNLPPRMRTTFGALLLMGVMPPKIRNYSVMFQFILRQLEPALTGPGVDVHDSSINKDIKLKVQLVCITEDSRGLKNPLQCKQSPAIIGGCPGVQCTVKGLRGAGTTVYISAAAKLPRGARGQFGATVNDRIRQDFADEFKEWPAVLRKLQDPAPAKMTMAMALRSARRVINGRQCGAPSALSLSLSLFLS